MEVHGTEHGTFIGAIMSVDSSLYEAAAGSLSVFEPPYVITGGAFGTGTYFVIMNKLAHESQKVGLASAMAIVLLILIMIATAIQKWVERYFFGVGEQEAIYAVKKRKKRLAAEAKSERRRVVMAKAKQIIWTVFKYFTLILGAFVSVLPVIVCVITAFKTPEEYQSTNVMTMPQSWAYF